MNPQNVRPSIFQIDEIVFTSQDGSFSISRGTWVEDEMVRFAIRWNGGNNSEKGYPSVRGCPMWFQLTNDLRELLEFLNAHRETLNQ